MADNTVKEEGRVHDDIGTYLDQREIGGRAIRELLEEKGRQAHTIGPASSVYDALLLMSHHDVGALIVLEGEKVIGVISERDYARKVILIGKNSRETTVKEIMSSPAHTATSEYTVADCLASMTDGRVRHLPVVDDGTLVGIVSIGDLVKSIIDDQGLRIEQYEKYVRGVYPT